MQAADGAASRYVVARAKDLPEGSRLITSIGGRSIGIFNVRGRFYAILNRCPHRGAALCKGDVIELVVSSGPGDVRLDRGMKLITCPAHGWEFDLETGQSWFASVKGKARPVDVQVESGADLVDPETQRIRGPYMAAVMPVSVEDEYVVVSLSRLATSRGDQTLDAAREHHA